MASKDDVRDFFEFRRVLEGLYDGIGAAMRFMDDQGIAVTTKKKKSKANGHANGTNMEALRETVKAKFVQRRKRQPAGEGKPQDGLHVTASEAAKILKLSDAAVRLYGIEGKLPKPTYELRPRKGPKGHDRKDVKTQVWVRDDILALAEQRKKAAKK